MILSFIVPAYNVEKYLSKCLDSLLNQGLDINQYEILVINDGSTDGSGRIAITYAGKYSQIKVIEQKNAGLGAARNTGIKHARGKYIQFVDSDDYLEENVLMPLLKKMDDESLDILRFNYQNVNEKNEAIKPNRKKLFVDYSDKICDGITFLSERLGYACYAWQFIIKTNLLKIPGNLFKEGIYYEDTEWTPRILVQAERITSVNKVVYNYLLRKGSITKDSSNEKKRKRLNDKIYIIDCLIEQKKIQKRQEWYNGMISHTVNSIVSYVALYFYNERKTIINQLIQKKIFPLKIKQIDIKNKIRITLLNVSPSFYCWLIHIKNN